MNQELRWKQFKKGDTALKLQQADGKGGWRTVKMVDYQDKPMLVHPAEKARKKREKKANL